MPKLNKTTVEVDRIIGAKVRQCRIERGVSQEKLAAYLGITFQQVQKYEKGTNRIALSTFFRICEALDISELAVVSAILAEQGDYE